MMTGDTSSTDKVLTINRLQRLICFYCNMSRIADAGKQ